MRLGKDGFGKLIFQVAIVFSIIYEVQLKGTSTMVTSRKLMLYLLVILFIFRYGRSLKIKVDSFVDQFTLRIGVVGCLIVVYVFAITLINSLIGNAEGTLIFPRAVYFVMFGPLVWYLAKDYFDSFDEFMRALLIASMIQVVIVIFQYHVEPFAYFLDGHFTLDAHTTYLDAHKKYNDMRRAVGLGAGDSLISIDLFLGSLSSIYLLFKKKLAAKYLVCYLVLLYGTVITGSIGTILTIFVFGAYCIYQAFILKNKKALLILLLAVVAVFICFLCVPDRLMEIKNSYIWGKIETLFGGNFAESRTARDLKEQTIAPLSIETFFGTGIYRGTSATGIICTSDFGYIQTYFGYGLVVAVVFYVSIFTAMFVSVKRMQDTNVKILMFLLAFSIAIAEIKEPYISHQGVLFVFFVACRSYFCERRFFDLNIEPS